MSEHDEAVITPEEELFCEEAVGDADESGVSESEETLEKSAEDYIAEINALREKLSVAIEEKERREHELDCITELRNAGLPENLSGFVMKAGEDAAEVVSTIRFIIDEAVERELRDRCRTEPPKEGARGSMTKEEFLRMPVSEIQRLRNMGIKLG